MGYFIIGILTGGAVIYVLSENRLFGKLNIRRADRDSPREEGNSRREKHRERAQQDEITYENINKAAKADFSPYASRFEGLYERLYQVTLGSHPRKAAPVLEEWEQRLVRLDLRAVLASWRTTAPQVDTENTAQQRAREWLDILNSWGIRRDSAVEIEVAESTARFYDLLDGEFASDIKIGDRFCVALPCWIWDDSVLERGIAQKSR